MAGALLVIQRYGLECGYFSYAFHPPLYGGGEFAFKNCYHAFVGMIHLPLA